MAARQGQLASSKVSSGVAMRLGKKADASYGSMWRCPQCKTTKSIQEGSFFTKIEDATEEVASPPLLQYPAKDAGEEAEVHKNTACDVYTWFREVCSTTLMNLSIVLGGPGKVVQVDESLIRHRSKVNVNYV